MSGPFNRGWDRVDFYTAALVSASQIFDDNDGALSCLDAVEAGTHYKFFGSLVQPDAVVSVTNSFVFVSIAGTQGWEQWVFNFLGSAQTPFPPLTGKMAAWFILAAGNVQNAIIDTIAPLLPTKRLILLGHSLGGAVAQILAGAISLLPNSGIGVYALGCPRVGDSVFAGSVGGKVLRCEDTDDGVVSLPPVVWAGVGSSFPIPGIGPGATYTHAGTAKTLDEQGNLTDGSTPPPLTQVVQQLYNKSIPSHLAQEYARRLRLGLTSSDLTPDATGYVNPGVLDQKLGRWFGPSTAVFVPQGGAVTVKVTLFFNQGSRADVVATR